MVKRKHPEAICEECPLYDKPCAPTIGPSNPRAAVISRSPGYHEAQVGKPFSGPAGKVLDFLLKEQGVERQEVLLTNVVLCAPDMGKVPPQAIKCCAPRVKAELKHVPLIIAAGSEAVNLLLGRGSIDRYRGYRFRRGRSTIVATNNPALALRDDSTFPNLRKDFRRAFNPIPKPTLPKIEVIENVTDAKDYLESLYRETGTVIAADIESRGGLTHRATLVSMQFSTDGRTAYVLGERGGMWSDQDFLHRYLRPFIESPNFHFVWHNGKFDVKVLRHTYGINARVDHDTMLMSYACDERSGTNAKEHGGIHKLEVLLAEEFGWPDYEPKSVKEFKKTGIVTNYDELYTYAGWDAAGTYQLFELLSERIRLEKVERPYRELLLEGSEACTRIELTGFRYDVESAADLMEFTVKPELEKRTETMRKIIDNPLYNPRSVKQTSELFYNTWGVRHDMQLRPDKKYSTDESALAEIVSGRFTARSDEREKIKSFAKELKRFRELSKQADTYIVGMIERAILHPEHKIYTDLLLHGTTSGRLSSRNPNLQNITRTKPGLPDIRSLFLASPGRQIVQADYSQAELRCIAYLSQDPELLRIYNENLDLHSVVAERFYGPDFTSEQRARAKNMNFGVAYGQGAATFQEKHGIPTREAEQFIDWWWNYFTGVKAWKSQIIEEMKTGRVVSPFGRVRRFYLLTKENFNASVREAVNFKPQSTAGDLTLKSVILLSKEIDTSKAAIVITVHDNIVADVADDYIDEYVALCKHIMESRAKDDLGWSIPMKVDIGIGPTWGEAK